VKVSLPPNHVFSEVFGRRNETLAGFMWSGKVRGEKCPFHLGQESQEISRKVRETCNNQGKTAFLYCRSGGKCHFSSS